MSLCRLRGMSESPAHMTADALLAVPDDGKRRELLDGVVRVMEPTGFGHGLVAVRIGGLLEAHVREHGLGVALGAETGFVLTRDPDTVRAPDAAFVTKERFDAVGYTDRYWPETPALAVEVVSPDDSAREVREKALMWLHHATLLVLVADPRRRTITAYRAPDDITGQGQGFFVDASAAVPGWMLPVADAFA